jgi:hypothetical protein
LRRPVHHRDKRGLIGGAGDDRKAPLAAQPDQAARGLDRPGFARRQVAKMQIGLALGRDSLQAAGVKR